jgi:hypothetical protein
MSYVNPNSANNDLLIRNMGQLRFTDSNDWGWNAWAGLAYKQANNQIVLGFPDGQNFDGNTNGTLLLSNVNQAFIGTTNQELIHTGNLTQLVNTLDHVKLTGTSATPFFETPNGITMSYVDPNSTNKDLLIRNMGQLRFTDSNDWGWNAWAGLAYKQANNQIVLGFPDDQNFNGNTNGTLLLSNVNEAYIGNTNQTILHSGNVADFVKVREVADEMIANDAQTVFTLSQLPAADSKVKMYINGIRVSNNAYMINGVTLNYNSVANNSMPLTSADRVQFDYYY